MHDVPTKFDTVRVYQHGPDGGVPVVLIHGFFLTSAMWWEQVAPVRARRAAAWITGHPVACSSVDMLTGLFVAGFAAFGPPLRTPALVFPSDHLLRSVQLPVQVHLAGNTVHDSQKAVQRIRSVVPTWRYHLWPNATHSLPAEIPDEVNACIRQFVIEHRGDARPT